MKKKRQRGQKYPDGFVKRKILLLLCHHPHPEGVEEPEIREFLRDEYNIRASKGIKNHLKRMVKEGLIDSKQQKGKANIWYAYPDDLALRKISKSILESEDKFEYARSEYVKTCLTDHIYHKLMGRVLGSLSRKSPQLDGNLFIDLIPKERISEIPIFLYGLLFWDDIKQQHIEPILSVIDTYFDDDSSAAFYRFIEYLRTPTKDVKASQSIEGKSND